MLLTKSNYMLGIQCPRFLWITIHQPEKLPKISKSTQRMFDQGHIVGELAQTLFKGGVLASGSFKANIETTKELIKKRKTIFEAGIMSGDLYARADILKPVGEEQWDLIEVKSSSKVKEEHLLDVAFQKYVYETSGIKINKCYVMYINTEYVRKGKIAAKKLLIQEDVTDKVDTLINNVPSNVQKIFTFLSKSSPPEFQLADIETSFYDNPVLDEFYESLPDGSVFELHRGGKSCRELFGNKICLLADIPDEFELTAHQEIQKKCAKTGKEHIDKEKIKEFLDKLIYPLYYLDFETFSAAVPMFDKSRPYQNIPFQYSLHVVQADKTTTHFSFLAEGKNDPRLDFLASLKKVLGTEGSIVSFNSSFENNVMSELAKFYPKEKKWVKSVIDRSVDLIVPFRNFYYYSPKQKGSASLKVILPTLTGKSYNHLEIHKGDDASFEFLNITFGDMPEAEKQKIRKNLEEYCGLDTEGMVWIVDELRKIVS
jgi:hypothetical protein